MAGCCEIRVVRTMEQELNIQSEEAAIEIDRQELAEEENHRETDQEEKKDGVEIWVSSLLRAEFYVQCECGAVTKGETNMFCIKCKGKAFCEKCRNNHENHTNKVIQVYKSSHATCFRKHDIRKMMDISSIQSFINNAHPVIYIRPRKSNGHRNGLQTLKRCEICSWELKTEDDKYCSISCKVMGIKSKKGWKTRNKGMPNRAVGYYGVQRVCP